MSSSPDAVRAWAPGRVNLIGDHTDYAGGLALPMAVDLGTVVEGRRGGGVVRLTSDAADGTAELPTAVAEPASVEPPWARYVAGVVHELAAAGQACDGFVGTVTSTVPLGAGLSSSASLEVATAVALGFAGSSRELAELCRRAEQAASGVPCGLMDQLTAVCGVADHALLMDFASGSVTPVRLPEHVDVVVAHSGEARELRGSAYAQRRAACERAAAIVGPLGAADLDQLDAIAHRTDRARARHVVTETARVRAAAAALTDGDLPRLGALLSASHTSLRDDFAVSTPALDALVGGLVAEPGIHGARLTGAGFGGCVVAIADRGACQTVDAALVELPTGARVRGWVVRAADGAGLR